MGEEEVSSSYKDTSKSGEMIAQKLSRNLSSSIQMNINDSME